MAVKPKAAGNMAAVKLEPGLEPLDDMQSQQQSQAWQLPQQPQQSAPSEALPVSVEEQNMLRCTAFRI